MHKKLNFAFFALFAFLLTATSLATAVASNEVPKTLLKSAKPFTGAIDKKAWDVEPHAKAKPLIANILLSSTKLESGKSYPIIIELVIGQKYHINSHTPLSEALIPTAVNIKSSDNKITIGRITYPPHEIKKFDFSKDKLAIYEGTTYILSSLTLNDGVGNGAIIEATIKYQACTNKACLLPNEIKTTATVETGTGGEPIHQDLFEKVKNSGGSSLEQQLKSSRGIALLLLVFLGGLALNLTPCVYPMIPVTVGFFGSATGRTKMETMMHAVTYVLGMALIYSLLGTIAALTGSLFGEMMQNIFVIGLLVAVMLILSLSMFGLYEIKVPTSLVQLSSKQFSGLLGTLFMGSTVGIIAAPCVGPFVLGLLTFVGEREDPLLGFTLFFVLALGLGMPFVFLAFFSSGIQALPRSGMWMVWVRKFFGVILLGMALYFALPLINSDLHTTVSALLLFTGGIYLGYAGRGIGGNIFAIFKHGIPIVMVVVAILLMTHDSADKPSIHFETYSQAKFKQAISNRQKVIVDFTADWCVPCRELKMFTFSDPQVIKASAEYLLLKVDFTRSDEAKNKIKKEFGAKGVPTVIIFDETGKEANRFTGFLPPDKFLKLL